MSRPAVVDFAGARGRIAIGDLLELGPRWAIQEKIDGALARVHLDRRGRVERILMRSGQEFPSSVTGGLVGAFLGWPDSVLIGELEAFTETANRHAARRGHRLLHLFDCLRSAGRYVAREPYRARRDELWRMQSEVVNLGLALPWARDDQGDAHDRSGRYCRAVPTDWRLAPIVPTLSRAEAVDVWELARTGGAEGLVAVNLDAPVGRRRAKVKCKPTTTIDAVVVNVGKGAATLTWANHVFAVSAVGKSLTVGDTVELAIDGFSERAVRPRNARIVRRRPDLEGRAG